MYTPLRVACCLGLQLQLVPCRRLHSEKRVQMDAGTCGGLMSQSQPTADLLGLKCHWRRPWRLQGMRQSVLGFGPRSGPQTKGNANGNVGTAVACS